MKKRLTSVALAGALGVSGLVAGLVVAPAVASAATGEATATEALGDHVSRIKDALAGLVSDGSITQEQADEVATTLAEQMPARGGFGGHGGHGFGGPGFGLGTALEDLGLDQDELFSALQDGQSLAEAAEAQGLDKQALIDALVNAGNARIDEAVEDGDLTQEEADERKAELQERVTAQVERSGLPGRGGHRGPWGAHPDSAEEDSAAS